MTTPVLVVIAILLFALVIFQLAKTTEFVAMLRGEEKTRIESDRINGRIMLVFIIAGMIAMFWSLAVYKKYMILEASSVHGKWIDSMFNVTLFFTGIVFYSDPARPFLFRMEIQTHQRQESPLLS
jgi:cytochrome c oxidase subunit 2